MVIRTIEVRERVMARNDELAADVRRRLAEHRVLALNLVSGPGAGKTVLLERTLEALDRELRLGIVTGDVQTQNDADRLSRYTDRLVQAVGAVTTLSVEAVMLQIDAAEGERSRMQASPFV